MTRELVVCADDLGLADAVNRGILRAHQDGIVTSASLMVHGAAAGAAGALAREHAALAVGLHLDLAEWTLRDGEWHPVYQRVDAEDAYAVTAEVNRQLAMFEELVGRAPTHLDSHQHVHRDEPVRSILLGHGRRLGIPVRHYGPARYCGAFYGQGRAGTPLPDAITVAALVRLVRGLGQGRTELCCHPSASPPPASDYGAERLVELEALCAAEVVAAVRAAGIRLRGP
jgi:predicted glycoside hydrolase/deacetylase ChbG (UPF0249 family)